MPDKPVIGVCDLGASGGRFFALYQEGSKLRLKEVYRFNHTYQPFFQSNISTDQMQQRFCWDLGRLYGQLLEGIRCLCHLDGFELKSFGIDTWGSDGTWITEKGDILGAIGTGRDPRWQQARKELFNQVKEKELFRATGIQSHPFNVLNQVYWYTSHEPEIVDAAKYYMPLHSLLYYYLTGECIAEHTWLSTTQLCTAGKKEYAQDIFQTLNMPLSRMTPISGPGRSLGPCHKALAEYLGTSQFEVVLPAVHDTACSYAVANCQNDSHTMVISTGTWFLAGAKLSQPLINDKAFESGFANEGGYDCIRFLKNIMGSWPAQQLRHLWSTQSNTEVTWEDFERLVLQGKPFNCILDVDHPLIFSAVNMEQAILEYCKLTEQTQPQTKADIARAVYEGIAMKVAMTAHLLGKVRDVPTEEILIVGGVSNSTLLNQWFADASGLPIRVGLSDATAFGNAAIQAVQAGWIQSVDQAVGVFAGTESEKIYQPKSNSQWNERINQLKEKIHNGKV